MQKEFFCLGRRGQVYLRRGHPSCTERAGSTEMMEMMEKTFLWASQLEKNSREWDRSVFCFPWFLSAVPFLEPAYSSCGAVYLYLCLKILTEISSLFPLASMQTFAFIMETRAGPFRWIYTVGDVNRISKSGTFWLSQNFWNVLETVLAFQNQY